MTRVYFTYFNFIIQDYNHYRDSHEGLRTQTRNEFSAFQQSLRDRFNSLKHNTNAQVGSNHDKQIEEALLISNECKEHVANSTVTLDTLEKSMQQRIDELEKKIADNLEQIRQINETCEFNQRNSDGFEKIGRKHYHIANNQQLDWYAANQICRQHDSHLASLQDEDELQELRAKLTESDYWLSLNDLKAPNEFTLAYTTQTASLLFWGPGEPKNTAEDAHCVDLQRVGSNDYVMSTKGCGLQFNFICEKVVEDDCDDCWTP